MKDTVAARMPSVEAVAALFETTRVHWRRSDRTSTWLRLFVVVMWVASLALLGLALWSLWNAWQTGDWKAYWDHVRNLLQLLFFSSYFMLFAWAPLKPLREAIVGLRRAAATGDERLAPPVDIQPVPLTDVEMPIGETTLGPLRGLRDGRRAGSMLFAGAFFMLMAVLLGILDMGELTWLIGILGAGPRTLDWAAVVLASTFILLWLITFALLGTAVFLIVWARRVRRGLYITADELGVRWKDTRWRTGRRAIPWHEAISFVSIAYRVQREPERRVYALNTADDTLFWAVGPDASEEDRVAAQRLCRLIMTRTKLPLRDLSHAAQTLAQAIARAARPMGRRDTPDDASASLLTGIYAPSRSVYQRHWILGLFGGLALLGLLLYPGAWGLQQYQEHLHQTHSSVRLASQLPVASALLSKMRSSSSPSLRG
jgi:hypothetical protein